MLYENGANYTESLFTDLNWRNFYCLNFDLFNSNAHKSSNPFETQNQNLTMSYTKKG